jgi:hypothetical protein
VRSPQVRFLGTLAVLLTVASAVAAAPLSDVLHLSDGTVVSGSIVEEEPGRSYTVETAEGERIVCRVERVQRIEKRLEPSGSAIQQRSIVFLADGVVFKGIIVERVPGGSVVLELTNSRLLHLAGEEIAKIATEPVAGGFAEERPLAPASTRKAIVEFQIGRVQNQLSNAEKRLKETAQGSDARAEIEAEVSRLRQELEALSEERERSIEEAGQEERKGREFEQEFGKITSGIEEARGEVARRVDSCSRPEIRDRMRETLAEIDRKTAEIVQRTEVVALTVEPDPRLVPIQQARSRNELESLIANRLWDDAEYRKQLATIVAGLPVRQRQQIYRENRQSSWFGRTLLNVIPFLSIGSWTQGDVLGAAIGMGSTIGGVVLAFNGIVMGVASGAGDPYQFIGGLALAGIGYVNSLIAPAIFVSDYNARLAKALGLRRGGGAP